MILITGATGGLGNAVADFLKVKNKNEQIAVMVRDATSNKAKELAERGFEIRVADYNEPASLAAAFEGVDKLLFVSGSDIAHRKQQHKNVVDAARNAKVGHIFYTSVSLNNLREDSALYGAMKDHIETEQWIEESGMKYTFLRHNLYGEVVAMFLGTKEQLMASKTVYLPAGDGKTAFVPRIEFAEADANAIMNAGERVNGAYEMNGSEKVTMSEVAAYLSDITGAPIAYVSPSVEEFEETLTRYGVPEMYIGLMSVFCQGIAEGVFDSQTSDLEKLLGRKSGQLKDFLMPIYKA